jgi:hypothetical protein
VNNRRVVRRLLRGAFAVLGAVIIVFVVSVMFVFLVPIPSRAVPMAAMIVFSGPEVFRPALHPPAATVWPAVSWIMIAVGFGIATRNVASRARVCGHAVVVVLAWLAWQEALANRYISNDWRRAKDRDLERGFLDQRESVRRSNRLHSSSVGVRHIEANAGDYQGVPFQSNVTVFWGFDQDGRLIDAWAWRTTDGL